MSNNEALANWLFEHLLADKRHDFGHRILNDTMMAWAQRLCLDCLGKGLTYQRRYETRHSPNTTSHPTQNIDTLIVYPNESQEHHILRGLTLEWVYRYWRLYEQVKDGWVERSRGSLSEGDTVNLKEYIRSEIIGQLLPLSLDEGLDLMALLTVIWARRFNVTGYFEQLVGWGHVLPNKPAEREEFAARSALWFLAADFQLEGV